MRRALLVLSLVAFLASLPLAGAQGGNGELRVWIETPTPEVEVPADGSSVDVPLTFRGRVSNSTCAQPVSYSFAIQVLTTPKVPVWANYTYGENRTVTFEWPAGDYRYVTPDHDVSSNEPRALRLQWPLAPPNATFVYKVSVGPPLRRDGQCVFSVELRPQAVLAVQTYLEGGVAPPAVVPVAPVRVDLNTTAPSDSGIAAAEAGADAPGPGFLPWAFAVAAAVAWSRRRR